MFSSNDSNYTFSYSYRPKDCLDSVGNIFIIAQLTEASIMTAVNLLVIFLYAMMRKRKYKISNYLLLSQSITDIYIAICLWFELLLQMTNISQSLDAQAVNLANIGMLEYSLVLSLGTILLGTVERYLSVTKSYYHKVKVTLIKVVYATISIWIISLIPVLVFLSLMDFNPLFVNRKYVRIYNYVFDVFMLLLVIEVVYILIMTFKTAKTSFSFQAPQRYSSIQRRRKSVDAKRRKTTRLVVIFIIMISAYTISFLPYIIGRLMYDTGLMKELSICLKVSITYVFHMLYKFSALFNPFLTIFLKEDYRVTLFSCLSKPSRFVMMESVRMTRIKRRNTKSDSVKKTSSLT